MKLDYQTIIIGIAAIAFLGYVALQFLLAFHIVTMPETEPVTFEIVGITGTLNASSLTSVHFECIKYCGDSMSDGTQSQYKCYEECATLGREAACRYE